MLLALHNAFASGRLKGNALDALLPRFVAGMQQRLCRFVDGGAGVGHTGLAYRRVLHEQLNSKFHNDARVVCYEPLEENFREMSGRLAEGPEFFLRKAAVTNENGKMTFVVPSRLSNDSEHWGDGTSYNGFVLQPGLRTRFPETIEVDAVRLEDDLDVPADFVKLDLQGGELDAIKGMGDQLAQTKLLYIECQMMADEGSCKFLAEHGYIILLDRFQFGLRPDQLRPPVAALRDLGIEIDMMHLPTATGLPLVMWGYLKNGRTLFDNYHFATDVRQQMREIGIKYFQSDALCINSRYANDMLPLMYSLI
jgi:FkbM family methyltransferase